MAGVTAVAVHSGNERIGEIIVVANGLPHQNFHSTAGKSL
jgi:hypothetical protein